ncbi:M28 family metallopeptidase [Ascoidea rubescens DSM 1968]|uniref:Zn-dependent exopeptidase n=1 Tax=Ascoidea rubescens DSM 1968 TaxID=1344418 RepID=A0A1D2VLP6_9ASCO|nr:Zn-dependent exopeptidase [Ascoidea rubescens DSM 1968]ODV62529.1 Zn-dependent exopeptidase [Ascoidea rubescens DSM 1968]
MAPLLLDDPTRPLLAVKRRQKVHWASSSFWRFIILAFFGYFVYLNISFFHLNNYGLDLDASYGCDNSDLKYLNKKFFINLPFLKSVKNDYSDLYNYLNLNNFITKQRRNHNKNHHNDNNPVRDFNQLKGLYLSYLGDDDNVNIREYSHFFTNESHLAGQNHNLINYTLNFFNDHNLLSKIDQYSVYLNYPVNNSLTLLDSDLSPLYQPNLTEDKIKEDPTTYDAPDIINNINQINQNYSDLIPAFHGYSANGNVTSDFVYANYGTIDDFNLLLKNNIEIHNKIVICRYGKIFRGLKVKFAQSFNASAVILYNDPIDDGNIITIKNGYKPYPQGPARNPSYIQRGSVQFLSIQPGDPTTPGYPSKGKNIKRSSPYNSIPSIPSLPISYSQVLPILKKLNGHGLNPKKNNSFKNWLGDLYDSGYDYSIGPNPDFKLNLFNNQSYNFTPIYNIYGEFPGILKNEIILIGNHRDAWIKGGAGDPNSGTAVMFQIIKSLNYLKQNYNFKPLRTIVFASWDGEEYGLLGSTEFGEMYPTLLKKKIVAYLNLDVATAGTHLNLAASPILFDLLKEIANFVDYPKGGTLNDFIKHKNNGKIGYLGSGSDYTVFLEHLGIPSVDLGFKPRDDDPIYHYHSNYDSFHWMEKFGDKNFVYHNTIAKYLGLIILKLSQSQVLKFNLIENSYQISNYFNKSVDNIPIKWIDQPITNKTSLNDNTMIIVMITIMIIKAVELQDKLDKIIDDDKVPPFEKEIILFKIRLINLKLKYLERSFVYQKGLNNRPWFRHIVFAAGRYTGYKGMVFPGLNEAIEDNDFDETVRWLGIINHMVKVATFKLIV